MLAQKDVILITQPVNAHLNIGYNAPYSGSYNIIIETGTNLEVSPFCDLSSDRLIFRCLDEDIPKLKLKYLLNSDDKDPYYIGISFSILKQNLKDKYQITKNSDNTILDFTKPGDRYIFIRQVWELYSKFGLLPPQMQIDFKSVLQQYEDRFITSNEVINELIDVMEEHYRYTSE
jgi:hypothetical protein